MPRFEFKALDENDRILRESMEGVTIDDIFDKLENRKLVQVAVDELNFDGSKKNQSFSDKFKEGFHRIQTKVPYKDVVFFTRQLAPMIQGGVPLSRSLEQLAKSERPVFKKTILQITEDISIGHTFADAIARHNGAFNKMYVFVVKSGEIAGALDKVLDQLATYMENVEALKSKVKAAMRYPLFIAGFVTVLIIGILWKLVPIFESMYAGFNTQLPGPTLLLLMVSKIVRDNLLFVILMFIGSISLYKFGMTKDAFKYLVHKHIFRFPVFGMILRKNILATYCRTMALLMDAGAPILEATKISGAVVNNNLYSKALEEVYSNLRNGELLSQSLEKTGQFPVLVTQLIATGEENGKVDDLLRKAAEFYEREIKNTVDSLAAIIEPFLIILLGGIVGSILIALCMPVFMIGKLIH